MSRARQVLQQLGGSVWAAAALGASLESGLLEAADGATIEQLAAKTSLDPRVAGALLGVLETLGLVTCDGTSYRATEEVTELLGDARQREVIQATLRAGWLQADHLYRAAKAGDRSLGSWSFDDPELLEAQGRPGRALLPLAMKAFFPRVPGLLERLDAPQARILDVGVGRGWIAIGFADIFTQCRVVGIDPHEPALEGARRNVAAAGYAERIELRGTTIQQLGESERYSAAFFPLPFFADAVVEPALAAVRQALEPGGFLITIASRLPADPLASAVLSLRDAVWGGVARDREVTEQLLRRGGFDEVVALEPPPGVPFWMLVARR